MVTLIIWLGIILCLSQSAMLSGLNLAFFSVSKLKLELEAEKGNRNAQKVMELRKDANFLLVTILWANVAVNVLLALLSGSVLTGVAAFLFSTVVITIIGEIIPQAYFSRHAILVASRLAPILRGYQLLLYPVAKPTALLLDYWLGEEAIAYYRERDLRELIKLHMKSSETEIDRSEGKGALNFLALDDLPMKAEGEPIDPLSILKLPFKNGKPVFPDEDDAAEMEQWVQAVLASGKKWVILTDETEQPQLVMNADKYLREVTLRPEMANPLRHCHRPILVQDDDTPLGQVMPRFRVKAEHSEDDVIDEDIILLWGEHKKIITGSDLLGRLMRGIVQTTRGNTGKFNNGG
ncbi:MAG: DUF21 domain-containing protein [Tindallia sp. MSAO_Bac2]|nr:MAG: DUF21 domain-containing protein [Tindallia sp. MSAO_Bac2]